GKGLCLEFLRHIERCAVIVHVLDCATLEPNRDPNSDLDIIQQELAAYAPDLDIAGGRLPLTERPQLVVLNKIDVAEARELADGVRPELAERGLHVAEISTASHEGLRELTCTLARLISEARAHQPEHEAAPTVLRPAPVNEKGFTVTRMSNGGTY